MLIDEQGNEKGILKRGEHKSLQTDRVILVPGPQNEIDIVQWIYRSFVDNRMNENEIAERLTPECERTGKSIASGLFASALLTNPEISLLFK